VVTVYDRDGRRRETSVRLAERTTD
jgi:hypothetical protein